MRVLCQVPRLAFFSEMQLKGLVRERSSWHAMRIDDAETGEPDVSPALLAEVQVREGACGCLRCSRATVVPTQLALLCVYVPGPRDS